ncbi:MAG TPA: RidA family protein [Polyangium sp.]|nr:RidA family protein [Polyangium sp.]
MNDKLSFVQPEGFSKPRGYSNGVITRGPTLHVAGQVGWNPQCVFERHDMAGQFAQALDNVLAVVRAAGGQADSIARMTIYVTDLDAYRNSLREFGQVWRERMGKHFPAMALVGVAGLVEREALIEIEAVAVLEDA